MVEYMHFKDCNVIVFVENPKQNILIEKKTALLYITLF